MIEIKNLTFSYTGKCPYLINKVNLNIQDGSYVSILGENGSAKTTLVKLILGLLNPLRGSINIAAERIGYVPQIVDNFNSQFPITVSELMKCHRKVLKIKNKKFTDICLGCVGMGEFKNELIGNLSGGQRQKIFIARALIGYPKLLIFDEPSTGIDVPSQKEIYSIIKHLNRHQAVTVLAVEHNLKAALENSTHICTMKEGNLKMYTVEEYKQINNLSDFN